jgi:histidinol-phosphate aminotransferase
VLADVPLVARLTAVQPLWPVSTPALAATVACVQPAALEEADTWARELAGERTYLHELLRATPGAQVVPHPAASFLLVRIDNAHQHRTTLRARGFAVRRGDTFPGLGPDWLRITVRDRRTSEAFVAALRDVSARSIDAPVVGP